MLHFSTPDTPAVRKETRVGQGVAFANSRRERLRFKKPLLLARAKRLIHAPRVHHATDHKNALGSTNEEVEGFAVETSKFLEFHDIYPAFPALTFGDE